MIRLEGRKALITGGSRGIGRAAAVAFARAGCDVAITYQSNDGAARDVQKEVEGLGRECLIFKVELSDKAAVDATAAAIDRRWGGLDIAVNNAGIWTALEMGNLDERILKETLADNIDGVFYVCNPAVPRMRRRGGGAIVNVSSTAAVRGEAFHSHYAASKAAVVALTKSLAVELAPDRIRVNAVAPGWVDTDMSAGVFADPEYREKVRQSIPLKRIPAPEDVAGPILFLASDGAVHITGETLNVNGGSVLCGG
ncbi:MAG: SDR family NAD(P)-dependent oxidoreductase [Candidatus Aminicenantales bacterium]